MRLAQQVRGLVGVDLEHAAAIVLGPVARVHDELQAAVAQHQLVDAGDDLDARNAGGHLLVQDDDVGILGGAVQLPHQRFDALEREDVEGPKVQAVQLGVLDVGLGVDERLPAALRGEHALAVDVQVGQHVQHDAAEEVRADQPHRADVPDTQGHEVGDDVPGGAEAVSLLANATDGQARLDGKLRRVRVDQPVGVQAKVPEYGHAGGGNRIERLSQPVSLLVSRHKVSKLTQEDTDGAQLPQHDMRESTIFD